MGAVICIGCQVDRTVVVTTKDYRGVVTSLCRACGAAEDEERVATTTTTTKGRK